MIWALPLLLALIAPYLSARYIWPISLLTIAFPWLCLINLLALTWFIQRRKRQAAYPLLALILSSPYCFSFINWQSYRQGNLRILSMNCNYFDAHHVDRAQVHQNIEQCQLQLSEIQPDVICAQDFSSSSNKENQQIDSFIRDLLGLKYRQAKMPSMATYARAPIENDYGLVFPASYNRYSVVDLQLDQRRLRIFNLHLQSYALGFHNNFFQHLHDGIIARSSQAETIARDIATSPYPVIVCGDFNDVPTSYTYKTVKGVLQDGFRQAGNGLSFTYQGPIPGLRIDYIFCSKELEFTGYHSLKAGSFLDHKWVVADLRWRT